MKIIAGIGHRPQILNKVMKYGDLNDSSYLSYIETIYYMIEKKINKWRECCFISGGALGVDLDFLECALYIKDVFNHKIHTAVIVPCDNQDLRWNIEDKQRYKDILDKVDFVFKVGAEYTFDCMKNRNEYLVDISDEIIAFYLKEEKGCTYNTINYAKRVYKNIEIVNLEIKK